MRPVRLMIAASIVLGLSGALALGAGAKEPPACAALTFRPVPSGLSDGEVNAGLYKSRFGRIVVIASVKNGEAQTYYVEVNGKPPAAISGAVPKSVGDCAKAKRLGAVGTPPEHCLGDKLAVLVDHSGDRRYVLLYAHRGSDWQFCSAGTT